MEVWPIILALVAVILATYYYFKKLYSFFDDGGIPTVKSPPLLGSRWKVLYRRMTVADMVLELYNTKPKAKYIGFYDFLTPTIMISDIELLKSITVKDFEHFVNHRPVLAEDIEPLFGKNLFGLRDERWKEVRAMLSPAFTSSKMKAMFVLMRDCAQRYGETLSRLPQDKRILDLKDPYTRYTNDVIATCAFGVSVDSMNDPKNKFYEYSREVTTFGALRTLKFFLLRGLPWLARIFDVRVIRKEIEDFYLDLVASTIKIRDEKGIVRPDMIQLMMATRGKLGPGKELTMLDMTAQAFLFLFGGFETTSMAMGFATYEVGVNPDIQKRLQEEIDQVLEDCNGEVTYEAINDMKYLDAVLIEALRLYPVAFVADRMCTKPYELPPALPGLKPYVIQKGDFVMIPTYGIHQDPRYYEEPKTFNPDRFLDDPKKIFNSGIFWSFGMGPRMCTGSRFSILQAKVFLFYVFAYCNMKPCSKTTIPMELSKCFQLIPRDGFWFEVEPRSKEQPLVVNSVCSNGSAC